jgi:hypothetical protein
MTMYVHGIGTITDQEWLDAGLTDLHAIITRPNNAILWMTGDLDADLLYTPRDFSDMDPFALRVDLYGGGAGVFPVNRTIKCYLGDSDIRKWTRDEFLVLGVAVGEAVRVLDVGGDVLINCQAGLNRSGLVTALVMMHYGMSPGEAIARIRSVRHEWCLANSSFQTWLFSEPAAQLAESIRKTDEWLTEWLDTLTA